MEIPTSGSAEACWMYDSTQTLEVATQDNLLHWTTRSQSVTLSQANSKRGSALKQRVTGGHFRLLIVACQPGYA